MANDSHSDQNHGPTLQEVYAHLADHYGHGWLAGASSGCRCVCHAYPKHGDLQDALEALKWHQERVKELEAALSGSVGPSVSATPISRQAVEDAVGFLSRPDREHLLERLGYTDAELEAYHAKR